MDIGPKQTFKIFNPPIVLTCSAHPWIYNLQFDDFSKLVILIW